MLLQQLLCRPQSQSLRDLGAEPDVEVGFVDPHPVQDTGKLARDRDDRAQHARPFGDPQAPGPQFRPLTKALPEKARREWWSIHIEVWQQRRFASRTLLSASI